MHILTHRALEPGNSDYNFAESSYEGFVDQLQRGFGLEFDFNLTKNKQIVLLHDSDLDRITNGKDKRKIAELYSDELRKLKISSNSHFCFFDDLAPKLKKTKAMHAFHIKAKLQDRDSLKILAEELGKHKNLLDRLIIFDLLPSSANFIRSELPATLLCPSVAHPHDIKRYNKAVGGTLLSLQELEKTRELWDWVWLDEWDLVDDDSKSKQFYTREVFEKVRSLGLKISLVTPELHASSPGLLGGEAHSDAQNLETLFQRIKNILKLKPDAVCSDYPEQVSKFASDVARLS